MKRMCPNCKRRKTWIGQNIIRRPKACLVLLLIVLCASLWFYSEIILTRRDSIFLPFQNSYPRLLDSDANISFSSSHFNPSSTNLPKLLSSIRTSYHEDRHSYTFWKSIKLQPQYQTGRVKHVRFGEPLKLFLPQNEYKQSKLIDRMFFNVSMYPETNGMVDCKGLILGDVRVSEEKQSVITTAIKHRFQQIIQTAKNSCEDFFLTSGYVTSSLTQEEASFPIAYSIVIFKDVEQFEILLRSIYRPQNLYCVHIDKKSSDSMRQSVEDLITCFDNVFIASTSIDVKWGTFTVLEPDMVCVRELFKRTKKWKYFINLTGQELPLRTNYEIVKVLKAFNGANNVGAVHLSMSRLKRSGLPPHGATPVKGAVHVILSREFVDFMLNNETAIDIYEWSKDVGHASEIYFSTLNYNPIFAAPGSYRGIIQLPCHQDDNTMQIVCKLYLALQVDLRAKRGIFCKQSVPFCHPECRTGFNTKINRLFRQRFVLSVFS